MKTVTVDASALRQVLEALTGPGHLIRELQATRGLGALSPAYANPIDTLIDQYNAALLADGAQKPGAPS